MVKQDWISHIRVCVQNDTHEGVLPVGWGTKHFGGWMAPCGNQIGFQMQQNILLANDTNSNEMQTDTDNAFFFFLTFGVFICWIGEKKVSVVLLVFVSEYPGLCEKSLQMLGLSLVSCNFSRNSQRILAPAHASINICSISERS